MARKSTKTEQLPIEPDEPEETVRFTIDLPLSLHQQLSLFAIRKRRPKAKLVRAAIIQFLENEAALEQP